MNSRKRQAQSLLPTRHPKQPRLTLNGYSGSIPNPPEKEGIGSRWYGFAKEFVSLVGDTLEVIVPARLRTDTDDSDSSVNQTPSEDIITTSSASSTPRQNLLPLHSQSTMFPQTCPLSPQPLNFDLQALTTPSAPSGSKSVLQPESIPLPPSPTNFTTYTKSPSMSTSIPTSFHTDLPNQSTPKHGQTSFAASTSAATPPRIPAGKPPLPSADSILQLTVVPNMRSLQLNGPSTLTSQLSKAPSIFSETQMEIGSQTSRRSSQSSSRHDPLRRNPRKREHIYSKVHKASVQRQHLELQEQITRDIYYIKRRQGFSSGFTDFKGLLDYQRKLQNIDLENAPPPLRPSALGDKLLPRGRRRAFEEEDDTQFLQRALDNAKATLNSPKPPKPFVPTLEQLQLSHRAKDADIERRLRPPAVPLPTSLPPDDEKKVKEILQRRGVVSKFAKEQVSQTDLSRLQPGQWLNDEIINFYGAMLLGRSESGKENPTPATGKKAQKKGPLNIHYFSSFFWSKLSSEGYEKGRLAKWTKKIDIFSKDIVLMPVNHGNAHWTTAAINLRAKRFESYDSMGMAKDNVFRKLREYIRLEHQNKKKKDFDFTGWQDWAPDSTPQQENGYDCGVFTCQFMEALSRGEDAFNFSQKDMPYLRRRMIWEIGNAKLRDDR